MGERLLRRVNGLEEFGEDFEKCFFKLWYTRNVSEYLGHEFFSILQIILFIV